MGRSARLLSGEGSSKRRSAAKSSLRASEPDPGNWEGCRFPRSRPPQVANYSDPSDIWAVARNLRKGLFQGKIRLSQLADLLSVVVLHWRRPEHRSDRSRVGSSKSSASSGLSSLKRFESSVDAFERSCDRLLRKLLAFRVGS